MSAETGLPLRRPQSSPHPSRVRHGVTALVGALGMITYFDRACIATLTPQIMRAFSLSKVQMGYVFSAFAFTYALCGIPSGRIGDRKGTRLVLTAIVAAWSVFTVGTGLATSFASLLAIRLCFGAAEAGAWPCAARTFSCWSPRKERGLAQGIFFACSHLAGGLTPFAVMALAPHLSWRAIFAIFGSVGLVWAAIWWAWFRDEPAQHPAVNAAELELIGRTIPSGAPSRAAAPRGFGVLLRCTSVWALCLMYLPNSFLFYFCITWLPTYLRARGGLDPHIFALFAGLPLLLSFPADLCGGAVTDWAVRRFGLRKGQCGLGALAYAAAAAALFATPLVRGAQLAGALLALATAVTMFTLPAAWGACIELAGRDAGALGAVMNTSGQVGSFICPLVVAYTLKYFASWTPSLWIMAGLLAVGAACWIAIDPERPLGAGTDPADVPAAPACCASADAAR